MPPKSRSVSARIVWSVVDLETPRIALSFVVDLETSRVGAACIFEYAGAVRLTSGELKNSGCVSICARLAPGGGPGGGSGVPWPSVFPFKYSILPQRYAKEHRFP